MSKRSRLFVITIVLALGLGPAASHAAAQEAAPDDTVKAIVALKCNCGIKVRK